MVILIGVFILIFSENILAVGVSHKNTLVNFEPNLKTQVEFGIQNIKEGTKLDISLEGDLKQYATIGDLIGNKLIVYLNLPEKIEKPGIHELFLTVSEIPLESGSGIMSVTSVRTPISIKVPYPGRYLEISLEVSDASVGENIDFKITAENLGEEFLDNVKGAVKIYSPDEELIDSIPVKEKSIARASKEEFVVKGKIKKEGVYRAVAELDYGGKIARDEKEFKVGILFIEIVNYDKWFKRGGINPFDIEIENKWNDVISGVYADIIINYENNSFINEIKTPGIDIGPWEKETITGLFDTTGFEYETYHANITIYYANKTTNKLVKIKVSDEGLISPFTLGYVVFLMVVIGGYFYIRRRKMKLNVLRHENGY